MTVVYRYTMYALCPSSVFIYILSCYCIVFNSTKSISKEYKLLIFGQATVTSIAHFTISGGSVPVLLAPCFGGSQSGFFRFLNFGTLPLLVFQMWLYLNVAGLYVLMIFYRYTMLIAHDDFLRKNRFAIYAGTFFLISLSVSPLAEPSFNGNQHELKLECVKKLSYIPPDYWDDITIMFSFEGSTRIFKIAIGLIGVIIVYLASFVSIISFMTYKTMQEQKRASSRATQILQRTFMNALVIQVAVQVINFVTPCLIVLACHVVGQTYTVASELCFVVLSISGITGPVTMILVTGSYRRACGKLLNKCLKTNYFTTLANHVHSKPVAASTR